MRLYQFLKKCQHMLHNMGHIYKQPDTALWNYSAFVKVQTSKNVDVYAIWINIINPYFQLIYILSHWVYQRVL